MTFSTANAERMRISSAGKVGVKTNSPQYDLDVYSTDDISMRIHRPSSGLAATDTCGIGFSHRGDTNTSSSDTRAGIFSTYNGSLFLATEPGGNLNSNPVDHAALSIVGTTQNVGIGTTDPDEKLHVVGQGSFEGAGNVNRGNLILGAHGNGTAKWAVLAATSFNDATGSGNGSAAAGNMLIGGYSDASGNTVYIGGGPYEINPATGITFNTHSATTHTAGGTTRMTINSSGHINMTSSLAVAGTLSSGTLTVNTDANSSLQIKDAGTNAIHIAAAAGDELYIGGNNSYALRFLNDGTNNVVFDNGSKVGIGTTSFAADGSSLLQVAGRLGIMENTGTQLQISTGATYAWMEAWDNTADRAPKRPICFNPWGGNVGIGTTTPTAKLQVGNNWTIDGSYGSSNLYIKASANAAAGDPHVVSTADIGLIITSASSNTNGPDKAGLVLHNDNTTAGGFSPMLLFTKRESGSTPYKATMAGIWAEAPTGTGNSNDWIDGQLHFGTAGAATGGVVSNMVIDKEGNVGINNNTPAASISIGTDNAYVQEWEYAKGFKRNDTGVSGANGNYNESTYINVQSYRGTCVDYFESGHYFNNGNAYYFRHSRIYVIMEGSTLRVADVVVVRNTGNRTDAIVNAPSIAASASTQFTITSTVLSGFTHYVSVDVSGAGFKSIGSIG